MKLNPSKCKELRIDFLQYKPSDLPPLQMSGSIKEQVSSYKLLGVHLSHNLSWSIHCDYIVKRARKRLYVLRVLMKSGLPPADLIQVYCSLVRPIIEYVSPVWAALPNCLVQLVHGKRAEVCTRNHFSRLLLRVGTSALWLAYTVVAP